MSFAIELSNYSIITSLNQRNIYIKCSDTINFNCYEANVDQKELRLQFELENIYDIINNCFKNEEGYSVNFNVSSGILKLIFNALVGGFLKINFEAILREKILSNDGQLTMNFNKMEQKYEALSKKFEKFIEIYEKTQEENLKLIDAVANANIVLVDQNSSSVAPIYSGFIYKINAKSVIIEGYPQRYGTCSAPFYDRVCEFYKLERLELNYFRQENLNKIKNNTLKDLKIECYGENCLKSILGTKDMPQLEKIEIYNAPALANIVSVLSSYKHKINTIILKACGSTNVVELQTYCQTNNIVLNIS